MTNQEALKPKSEQDIKDNAALDHLMQLLPIIYEESNLFQIIKGTTIGINVARALVAGMAGEFTFSNGEKRQFGRRF